MLRVLIKIALAALLITGAWRVGSTFLRYYQFEDALQEVAQFGDRQSERQLCTTTHLQSPVSRPHHTISHAGLVGGGQWPRPGEISLAHRGVLILDEMPEFGQRALEVLRQPLDAEGMVVTISRAQGSLTFPANFMLVGAMNPCPCGYFGDTEKECTCSGTMIARYQKRLSGPLLDRIDIHVEVPRVPFQKLSDERRGESLAAIRNGPSFCKKR
jgi:predicted ATPase with chaperone activity